MNKLTVTQYLVQELHKLGIEDFFGLPGDYNFNILDSIIENPRTNWVGCTNELNAGYAADGYARIKGYGALVTTYGVGELSAVNAIAGSYAESVPVIKIAGLPSTEAINKNTVIHHNFQNPDYMAFERVFSNVSASTARLSFENAKGEIDRVISLMLKEQKPVYLAIPADVCLMEIDCASGVKLPVSDEENLKKAVEHALSLLNKAKNPMILADALIERFKSKKEFENLLLKTNYPFSTLLMGKGVVNESNENFTGTFQGEYGNIEAYKMLSESDCSLSIGVVNSDINTMRFSLPFSPDDFINIQGTYAVIENIKYENVLMKDILEELSKRLNEKTTLLTFSNNGYKDSGLKKDLPLSADYIFPKLQEFIKPNDSIFAETGIIPYAMAPVKLPNGTSFNSQVLWGSIGWATPASFGGAMALKDDSSRRTILITGEGSHQLTAMEVGTMMRHNLRPIIFVFNNDGYTIERYLSHNPMDSFNEIAHWNYSKIPGVFEGNYWTAQARTNAEFDDVLKQAEKEQSSKLCYIELFTDKMDAATLTNNILKGIKVE